MKKERKNNPYSLKLFCLGLVLAVQFNCCSQSLSQNEQDSVMNNFFRDLERSNNATINKSFPPFSWHHDNLRVDNKSLKGKVVFINFWFEACTPCVAEFGGLNDLYDSLKNNSKFAFISFTFEKKERIEELKAKYSIHYPILYISQQECYRLNNKNGFPTNIILDPAGLVKYRISGGNTDKDKAREFIFSNIYPRIVKLL